VFHVLRMQLVEVASLIAQVTPTTTTTTPTSAAVPNPTGAPPPGSEKLLMILNWAAWLAAGAAVAGIFLVAGLMAIQHQHGRGGEHGAKLMWVMGGCVLIGSGSGIVGALV